ncbi:hypothetical protein CP995_30230, partial [Klebsiella pneumoniae]
VQRAPRHLEKTESDGRSQSRRLNPAGPAAFKRRRAVPLFPSLPCFFCENFVPATASPHRHFAILAREKRIDIGKVSLILAGHLTQRRQGDISTPLTSPTIDSPEDKLRC